MAKDTTLIASGELTESSGEALRQVLELVSADEQTAWTLDLSGVNNIDQVGAEILANFLRAMPHVRTERPSQQVQDFFARIGAETLLVGDE